MSESFVQVPPDSTGKKIRAIVRTIDGQDVHEEVFIVSVNGTLIDPRQIRTLTDLDIVTIANQILLDAQKHGQIDVLTLPNVVQESKRRSLEYPEGTLIDPRNIRALTSSDVVDVSDRVARELGKVDVKPSISRTISGRYLVCGIFTGSTSTTYVHLALWNPVGSGVNVAVRRISIKQYAVASANYIMFKCWNITSISGGTQYPDIAIKKRPDYPACQTDIVTADPTITAVNQFLITITAGAVGQFPSDEWISERLEDDYIMQAGSGIAFQSSGAGDVDQRTVITVEWEEYT